jgi:hypothetical protein
VIILTIRKRLTISAELFPAYTTQELVKERFYKIEEVQEFLNQLNNRSGIMSISDFSDKICLKYDSHIDEAYQASLEPKAVEIAPCLNKRIFT